MNKVKNIGITGAGPASLTFAINYKLIVPDSDITIYEKEVFPRHKVGESLLLPVPEELKQLGLLEKAKELFHIKKGASYKWGKNPEQWWTLLFNNNKYSFHVRRSLFDMLLAKKAIELGVKIKFNTEVKIKKDNKEKKVKYIENKKTGKKTEHEFYIDGSGLNKVIVKEFNELVTIEKDKRIAFYGYLKNIKELDSGVGRNGISIISFNKGWIWHIPLDDYITSIGIVTSISNTKLFNTKEKFISALKNNKHLNKFITNYELYNEWGTKKLKQPYSIKNWSYTNGITYGKNWVAIGDAAYFHDPILSQGVTLAMSSGHDCAISLKENKIKEFVNSYYKQYISFKKMTDFWYEHNSVEGWEKLANEIVKSISKENIYKKEAFSYLTLGKLLVDNLKNGWYFDAGFFYSSRKLIYENLLNKNKIKK